MMGVEERVTAYQCFAASCNACIGYLSTSSLDCLLLLMHHLKQHMRSLQVRKHKGCRNTVAQMSMSGPWATVVHIVEINKHGFSGRIIQYDRRQCEIQVLFAVQEIANLEFIDLKQATLPEGHRQPRKWKTYMWKIYSLYLTKFEKVRLTIAHPYIFWYRSAPADDGAGADYRLRNICTHFHHISATECLKIEFITWILPHLVS